METIETPAIYVSVWALAVLLIPHPGACQSGNVQEAFRAECSARAELAPAMTVFGRAGWYFFKDELRHAAEARFWATPEERVDSQPGKVGNDPFATIVDLHEQLANAGIRLIVCPAPLKTYLYADKLSDIAEIRAGSPIPRLDPAQQHFYRLLREKGVSVVDVLPILLERRFQHGELMYCRTDTHWTSLATVYVARAIVDQFRGEAWLGEVRRRDYEVSFGTREIGGDFKYLVGEAPAPAPERVPIRQVGEHSQNGLAAISADPESPVLIVMDSYGRVFHSGGEDEHGMGAGLPDQMAYELGFPVDVLAGRGSAIRSARLDLLRRSRANPEYLGGKKVIIWCFASRYFTVEKREWTRVPVIP